MGNSRRRTFLAESFPSLSFCSAGISNIPTQCWPVKILLALMTVLIGPLSLITLQVSINNIVNMIARVAK